MIERVSLSLVRANKNSGDTRQNQTRATPNRRALHAHRHGVATWRDSMDVGSPPAVSAVFLLFGVPCPYSRHYPGLRHFLDDGSDLAACSDEPPRQSPLGAARSRPVRAFVTGRAREWEVVPLVLLVAIAVTGVLLAFGIPAPENPLRMRVQLVRSSPFRFGFGKSVSSAISARRRCRG